MFGIKKFIKSDLSIHKDPFKKSCLTRVSTFSHSVSGTWYFTGCVEFTNGNTTGEQKFKGSSFDDVLIQIKAFLETLED